MEGGQRSHDGIREIIMVLKSINRYEIRASSVETEIGYSNSPAGASVVDTLAIAQPLFFPDMVDAVADIVKIGCVKRKRGRKIIEDDRGLLNRKAGPLLVLS